MEINEALGVLQTLVHCQGISREWVALDTIRTALAEALKTPPNTPQAGSPEGSSKPCDFCFKLVYLDDTRKNNRCPVCCRKIRTASACG
jgi:hypothetical protein